MIQWGFRLLPWRYTVTFKSDAPPSEAEARCEPRRRPPHQCVCRIGVFCQATGIIVLPALAGCSFGSAVSGCNGSLASIESDPFVTCHCWAYRSRSMDLLPKGSPVRLIFELRSFLDQYEIASDATRSCVARSNSPKLRLSSENVTAAPSGQGSRFQ
jgi:hypothetical protein